MGVLTVSSDIYFNDDLTTQLQNNTNYSVYTMEDYVSGTVILVLNGQILRYGHDFEDNGINLSLGSKEIKILRQTRGYSGHEGLIAHYEY